ncbi:MAG: hypothetical protein FWF10_09355 [Clostridiales bacterium]|nr:hypothetical protein [Clostridiales bacterium]
MVRKNIIGGLVTLCIGAVLLAIGLVLSFTTAGADWFDSGASVFCIVGFILLVIGIAVRVSELKKRALQIELRANGACTMATVSDVTKCVYYRSFIPIGHAYEFVYRWQCPKLGIIRHGKIRNLKDDPRPYLAKNNNELPVYFDPNNPQCHFLDLSMWM